MARKVRKTTIPVPIQRAGMRSALERRVLEMLESGVAYNIGDLAARLHLSPSHLQRMFKRESGVRLGEWLITQRLHDAAYLLANSYLSVKEIATCPIPRSPPRSKAPLARGPCGSVNSCRPARS